MAEFSDVHIFPMYPRTILVQWELENNLVPGDVKFDVFKAYSPGGEFVKITDLPVINSFYFKDQEEIPLSKLYEVYYKVRFTDALGKTIDSEPKGILGRQTVRPFGPALIAKEITRRNTVLLNKFTGVPCTLLKLKHFGQRCSECFNYVTNEITHSDCKECFGTGFLQGYHIPISIKVQFDLAARTQRETDQLGVVEDTQTQCWTLNAPFVKKADVIVDNVTNDRWFIHEVQLTGLQNTPVRQIMRVKKIERHDPIYSVSVEDAVTI